jgi:tripartite-type tricarboxylate transporter receptor subunit TctC
MRIQMHSLALLAIGSFISLGTIAADYPERPLQVIVPFAAGGGLDSNARAFSQALSQELKTPVAVVNRDGAAGSIGLQAVASARPDGYTLAFTPAVSLTSEPHRLKSIQYRLDSFKPVCQVFDNIFAIVVKADSPFRTVADVLESARRDPGGVSYGTSGTGSIPHLGSADIEAATRVQLVHVPYKGDGPMLQDVLGGRLAFGAMLASSVSGQVQAGALRLLAVYSDSRHPAFPSVPTLTESGVPVVQLSFGGLLAPANTPQQALATLEAACERATRAVAYREYASKAGQVVSYQSAAQFSQRLGKDSEAKASTLRRLGL